MKKIHDEKRAKQEAIKQQKKASSSMSSYVERVLDFLEKQAENPAVPKHLQEDLQWSIEIISQNKMYSVNTEEFQFRENRDEVKAWTNLINLKNIPQDIKELERLRQFEAIEQENLKNKKKLRNKNA